MSALAALTVSLSVPSLWGQETRATLQGTVQDSGGGVLPGAQVTATHTGTNVPTAAVANEKGFYVMPYLMPGTYTISAQMPGFKQARRAGVSLSMSSSVRIDIELEPGVVEEPGGPHGSVDSKRRELCARAPVRKG